MKAKCQKLTNVRFIKNKVTCLNSFQGELAKSSLKSHPIPLPANLHIRCMHGVHLHIKAYQTTHNRVSLEKKLIKYIREILMISDWISGTIVNNGDL